MQESIQLCREIVQRPSSSTGPVNQYSDTNQPQLSTYVRFFILLHFIKLFLYVFPFSTTAVLIALTTTAVNVQLDTLELWTKRQMSYSQRPASVFVKGTPFDYKADLFNAIVSSLYVQKHTYMSMSRITERLWDCFIFRTASIKSL